jgi:hypothetical protein
MQVTVLLLHKLGENLGRCSSVNSRLHFKMQSGIKDTSVPFGNTIFDIVGCNLGTPEVGQVGGGGGVAVGAYAGQAGFS